MLFHIYVYIYTYTCIYICIYTYIYTAQKYFIVWVFIIYLINTSLQIFYFQSFIKVNNATLNIFIVKSYVHLELCC